MKQSPPSVLVVDDVEANLVAMEAQLAGVGCEVVCAASGNEALRQLLRREFAVVLLDVQMPGMNGFEVATLARAEPTTRDVPIIFVTAMHESHEHLLRGYGAGAVDLLYKPLDAYVLRSKVQVFVDLYVARRRLADEIEAHRKTSAEVEACAALIGALDLPTMLDRLGQLVVPLLADWCRIVIAEPAQVATAVRLDPRRRALADELERRATATAATPWGSGRVLQTGRSELYPELPDAELARRARDDDELRLVRQLAIASTLIVPLPARGRTIGALALLSCDPARRFQPTDLAVAEELGRRVGLAVDNVLLHAEARDAIQARDEFLSIASHELRTPVTSLQMQHELLREALRTGPDAALPARIEDKLRVAVRQTSRLAALIDNLLDVSRITTGHCALDASVFDLAELAAEVIDGLAEASRRAGCTIEARLDQPVRGTWDRVRLGQVLTNLLSNAIKFGAGRPIEVAIAREAEQAVLTVCDHGIGIDGADARRIFDRFERAVSARNYGGLGLGLYIARHSVEALGGSIAVTSTPGEGATFAVTLPLEPPAVGLEVVARRDPLASAYAGLTTVRAAGGTSASGRAT